MATAEEKQAYLDEVKAAQEEAADAALEPSDPDIFQSEWDAMLGRQSQGDAAWLFAVTEEHGGPNIVADPEPPPVEETGEGETPPEEGSGEAPNQDLPEEGTETRSKSGGGKKK
jgi:hypothetical protein